MDKKKIIVVLNFVLLIAALVLQLFGLAQSAWLYGLAASIVNVVTVISGMAYVFMHYKKNAAVYYKIFMICLSISVIFSSTAVVMNLADWYTSQAILTVLNMILVGSLFVLSFAQDLGYKKSQTFGAIAFVTSLLHLIVLITHGADVIYTIAYINILILVFIMNIMINGKYMDKRERGREV